MLAEIFFENRLTFLFCLVIIRVSENLCPSGEIGRRTVFRSQRREACWFESSLGHQTQISETLRKKDACHLVMRLFFRKFPVMHITLRQLEIFLGIYDQKSLSKAAAKLCVTTSAASQSLKELERILGTELFERKSNGLFPTDAASALLPLATLVVTKVSEIEEIFAAREKGLAGKLIIGANRASGIYILSRRLPEFKRRYPTVDPTLLIEDNEIVEAGVLDNRMDIGFISRPPVNPSLTFFPCFRDDFVLIASPKSPYISVEATTEDFCLATWIMDQEATVSDAAKRWLLAQGITVSNILTMNTMGAIKRAVQTGLGLAVMPLLSVSEEIRRGDLVELRKEVNPDHKKESSRCIYAIYKQEHLPALRELFFKECNISPLSTL